MSEFSEDDGVGYGKPPKRNQFQKGKSGNPKGRQKGSGVRTSVEKVLARTIPITVDGVRRRVPITEAMVTQLAQRALAGDPAASRDFLKIAGQAVAARAEDDAKPGSMTIILKQFGEPEGCYGALDLLNAITQRRVDGEGCYRIEPWVVEAARARGLQLDEAARAQVEAFTAQAGDEVIERVCANESG